MNIEHKVFDFHGAFQPVIYHRSVMVPLGSPALTGPARYRRASRRDESRSSRILKIHIRPGGSKRSRCKAASAGPCEAYIGVRRSERPSAPTPQMGLFQQPATGGRGGGPRGPRGCTSPGAGGPARLPGRPAGRCGGRRCGPAWRSGAARSGGSRGGSR